MLFAAGDKIAVQKTDKFSKNAGLGHCENNPVICWVILISDLLEYSYSSRKNNREKDIW